jgi:zinc transport system substrate-binding protein
MKNIITLYLLSTLYIFANINAIVSIMPQKVFLEKIGGDKVNISLMVKSGSSPHTYEPKPSQMVDVANADIYFAIDVEFEDVWLPKFLSFNKKMEVVDVSYGIMKRSMENHVCTAHDHAGHDHSAHGKKDPHIWTSPANVKQIAQTMYQALVHFDKENAKYYETNLKAFIKQIDDTDRQLHTLFSKHNGTNAFMVFHPSWGYFADSYKLEQIAVEVEGKSPKPKELITLIKKAREKKVTAIFTQPEFSDASAKIIAMELGIPVVKASPMAQNWSENLITMAKVITGTK